MTYCHSYIHVHIHVCFADYEDIANVSVIIRESDELYTLNLTIYNDADFSELNETLVITLSVGFVTKVNDADAADLQSRIFLDQPTTTITIINSGKTINDVPFLSRAYILFIFREQLYCLRNVFNLMYICHSQQGSSHHR